MSSYCFCGVRFFLGEISKRHLMFLLKNFVHCLAYSFLAFVMLSVNCLDTAFSAQDKEIINIECQRCAFGECIKRLEQMTGYVITVPYSVSGKDITISVKSDSPQAAALSIAEATNIPNVIISSDANRKTINISFLDFKTTTESANLSFNSEPDATLPSPASSPEELLSLVQIPNNENADEVLEWPDGTRHTLRELEILQQKQEIYKDDPEEVVIDDSRAGGLVVRQKDVARILDQAKNVDLDIWHEEISRTLNIPKNQLQAVIDSSRKMSEPLSDEELFKQ